MRNATPIAPWRALLRRERLLVALFALAVSLIGIGSHGVWPPDEPRESGMAREMLEHHFSALPTLAGAPFLEKPPLFLWLAAASAKWFGTSALARLDLRLIGQEIDRDPHSDALSDCGVLEQLFHSPPDSDWLACSQWPV